jgi:antitoxin VapB
METAKIFMNGGSQAVRLPKETQFRDTAVYIQKIGDAVILFPRSKVWETFLSGLNGFTDDAFAEDRRQPMPEKREGL